VKRERSREPVEIGKRYGWLTVVAPSPSLKARNGASRKMWECACSCGQRRPVREESLRTNQARSCGCRRYQRVRTSLVGQVFERLTVLAEPNLSRYLVRCECGHEQTIPGSEIQRRANRCGRYCDDMKGKTDHPLYAVWRGIKSRCTNPKDDHYADYGGRGIFMHQAWQDSFVRFVVDVGERPPGVSAGRALYSLDRIDVNGSYEPSNVRWATQHEQCANKRLSREHVVDVLKAAEAEADPVAYIRARLLGGVE
jgi:hypothetical protein